MSPREPKYRKEEVLAQIVEAYLETGVPVSSKLIVERGMDCSSATVRNIMAELTDEGYLIQPHTSAGRIPTQKAYRYYLDYILDVGIQRFIRGKIESELERVQEEIEDVARKVESVQDLLSTTVNLISELAHQTGMSVVWGYNNIYVHGRSFLIDYQEFQDIEKIRKLLSAFEMEDVLYEIFWKDLRDRVDVFLGKEIGVKGMEECALVISYCGRVGNREVRLGLFGPMRMDYVKNVSLLEQVSHELEELWQQI